MILVKPSHEILTPIDGARILQSIEAAGRTCYKSEAKITDESAKPFAVRILKMGHLSVIEHESISVRFVCDRGVTHELVRHRLAAYSQESTRYCNYGGGVTFVIPPWVDIPVGGYHVLCSLEHLLAETGLSISEVDVKWFSAMCRAEGYYLSLLESGWSPQQARSVLPNSLKTEIVMTANLREWRHVLKLRTSRAAHPQMKELMFPLLAELQQRIPIVFNFGGDWTAPDPAEIDAYLNRK